tara:strand:- start:2890 stop:3237 length:348 start_codon:yes stop_codon:yes gene_type:complete
MQHGGDNMQDWTPMVLNSKKAKSAPLVEKKSLTAEQKKTIELSNITDAQKTKMMSREVVKQLIDLRTSKKKTQKQLANELNIIPKIIQDIETYRHQHDMQLAQRIARHLGGRLKK